ncbi:MAG: hypothetical protein ACT6QS_16605 [Flavobacteriales bacterium]
MRTLLLVCCSLLCTGLSLYPQVKIGDNPTSLNSNSLLELESSNKGFLVPRVSLTGLTAAAPLTAPVPVGMTVYNTGAVLPGGYYFWDGGRWLRLLTSANMRDNYVLVKSAADFPAPVGGVITLAANTTYEINGTITLSSRINLNGAKIDGMDAVNDRLVYTPGTGELFTGNGGGNIRSVTLSAPTAGGRLFGINAAGANSNLTIQNCYIIGCNNVGVIQGFGGTVFFNTVAFFSNTNGVTFQNDTNVVLITTLWDKSNSNIYERFTGTFSLIQKLGGDMLVSTANSATAFDISGISSLDGGELKSVLFSGNGTYTSGTFSKSWEVESHGLTTQKDDVASGNFYISAPGSTTFAAINTPVKIIGTTTAANLFRMTMPANNRLTYTGTKTRRFQVICSLSITAASNNKVFSFFLARNGTTLAESRQFLRLGTGADRGSVTLSCTVQLAANDYVEVWAANNTDTTPLSVESMNLALK